MKKGGFCNTTKKFAINHTLNKINLSLQYYVMDMEKRKAYLREYMRKYRSVHKEEVKLLNSRYYVGRKLDLWSLPLVSLPERLGVKRLIWLDKHLSWDNPNHVLVDSAIREWLNSPLSWGGRDRRKHLFRDLCCSIK